MIERKARGSFRGAAVLLMISAGSILGVLSGCGRYARPLTPEAVSPAAVVDLKVQGIVEGITLSWNSPSLDRRGKELVSLDGYTIERKSILKKADAVDPDIEFEQLATIQDLSVMAREDAREKLRAEEKPSHRARVDSSLTQFSFTDTSPKPGGQYLYRVVPQSVYGEGAVQHVARVIFRGGGSEITLIKSSELDEDLTGSLIESSTTDEE